MQSVDWAAVWEFLIRNSRRTHLTPHPPRDEQVQSLSAEHNPDIMLLAARAITHLADVLPASW